MAGHRGLVGSIMMMERLPRYIFTMDEREKNDILRHTT